MESEAPRAGDRGENSNEDKLEKIFSLVVGLDDKMNEIESRIAKLEEDDVSTVALRSINETAVSEDSSKEEKLSLLAEGFVLPERTSRYKYDKGVEKLIDQIVANINMNKLWPSINKNYYKIRKYILELFSFYVHVSISAMMSHVQLLLMLLLKNTMIHCRNAHIHIKKTIQDYYSTYNAKTYIYIFYIIYNIQKICIRNKAYYHWWQ